DTQAVSLGRQGARRLKHVRAATSAPGAPRRAQWPAMTLLLTQARANRLANRRLLGAVARLSDAEFHAPRTSFFPSLALTLNHVLNVDHYYLAALHGDTAMRSIWATYVPATTAAELAARQDESDQRLVDFCAGLQPADEDRIVA